MRGKEVGGLPMTLQCEYHQVERSPRSGMGGEQAVLLCPVSLTGWSLWAEQVEWGRLLPKHYLSPLCLAKPAVGSDLIDCCEPQPPNYLSLLGKAVDFIWQGFLFYLFIYFKSWFISTLPACDLPKVSAVVSLSSSRMLVLAENDFPQCLVLFDLSI